MSETKRIAKWKIAYLAKLQAIDVMELVDMLREEAELIGDEFYSAETAWQADSVAEEIKSRLRGIPDGQGGGRWQSQLKR